MQLLTHYDHVIVQSLIVYPVCDAKSVTAEKMWHFFFLSFSRTEVLEEGFLS